MLIPRCSWYVRFASETGRESDIQDRQLRARADMLRLGAAAIEAPRTRRMTGSSGRTIHELIAAGRQALPDSRATTCSAMVEIEAFRCCYTVKRSQQR